MVDELYSGDPEAFVARRKELAAQARAVKDRTLAADILALRRPTKGAWLVNLLARADAEGLGQLLDLGPALAEAHTGGTPAGLRELTSLRRRIVASLVERAVVLGLHRGYDATPAVRDEVARALDAALADPVVATEVRAGRLAVVPESAASFPTQLFAGLAPAAPARAAGAEEADDDPEVPVAAPEPADGTVPAVVEVVAPAVEEPAEPDPATVAELRALLKRCEAAAVEAGQVLAAARDEVAAAGATEERARQEAAMARAVVARREKAERAARDAVEAARRALVEAEAAAEAARREREAAEADVELAAGREEEAAEAAGAARDVEAEAGAAALRAEADLIDALALLDRAPG